MSQSLNPLAPPDHSQREKALDITRNTLVIAPAGSGKTTLLVNRFLKCLNVSSEPEEVVAITFTNKAAAEIRARLVEALRHAKDKLPPAVHNRTQHDLAQAVLARDEERGWKLLENPNRLRAMTIDSLNAELAGRLPLLSRLGGSLAISEDSRGLFEEAVKALFAELEDPSLPREEREALETVLRGGENRLDLLVKPLVAMLEKREQWLELVVDLVDEQSSQDESVLRALAQDSIKRLDGLFDQSFKEELVAILHEGSSQSEILEWVDEFSGWPAAEAELLIQWRHIATLFTTGSDTLRKRVNKNDGFSAKQAYTVHMNTLLESLKDDHRANAIVKSCAGIKAHPGLQYPPHLLNLRQALARVLMRLAAQLQVVFSGHGEADFTEVALAALRALSGEHGYSEVLDRADARIRHLLVDEMQDTSDSQLQLLRLLTSGWMPEDGHSLFMVGDPQQSIYAFRKAEVRLFLELWDAGALDDLPLERIQLSTNFRSNETLISWFNDCFSRIFPSESDLSSGAVSYSRCEPPKRETASDSIDAVTVYPFPDDAPQEEAEAAAQRAKALLKIHGDKATIAILARTRRQLRQTIAALRRHNIPCNCQDIDPLHDIPAVREYVQLTRALWHPEDRLAWAILLRSPLVGMSYADLVALSKGTPAQTWPEKIRRSLADLTLTSPEGHQRLTHLVDTLAHVDADPLLYGNVAARAEAVWHALGGPATMSPDELHDLQIAMRHVRETAASGEIESLAKLRRSLASVYGTSTAGSVQVMTAHKCKGLEFDHVLLVGCGGSTRSDDRPLLQYYKFHDNLLLAPKPPAQLAEDDPAHALYDYVHTLQLQASRSERLRLLYVCCTRARRTLSLFASASLNKNDEAAPKAGSFSELLWPVIRDRFDALAMSPLSADESLPVVPRMPRLPEDYRFRIDDKAYRPQERRVLRPSEAALDAEDTKQREGNIHAQLIGTMYHEAMRKLAQESPESWKDHGVSRQQAMAAGFRHLGMPEPLVADAVDRVLTLLKQTRDSEHGQWLLAPRSWARNEYALAGYQDGRWVSAIIDRCFQDEDGIFWVIDYKTTAAPITELAQRDYLTVSTEKYRSQVESYARLLQESVGGTVRAALYFPDPGVLRTL